MWSILKIWDLVWHEKGLICVLYYGIVYLFFEETSALWRNFKAFIETADLTNKSKQGQNAHEEIKRELSPG